MRDEPLKCDIDVVLLFTRNGVATNFAILDRVQVHFLDQPVLVQGVGKIPLVAQHQNRDSDELWLFQQVVKLVPRGFDFIQIGGVHHVDDGVDTAAVPLPHGPEPGLTADVPELDGDVPLRDFSHVEPDRRDHVLVELAGRDDVDEGRLSGVLQSDLVEEVVINSEFQLLKD